MFLAAIAVLAAALADPLVETVANSGVLGRGYTDNNHLSVIPALVAGALLVSAIVAHRCSELWRHSRADSDWVLDIARHISALSPVRDLPLVLVLQFAALFVMESTEQLVFGGKVLGGVVWLGGPVAFSLLTHASIGTVCAIVVTRAARAVLRAFANLVGIARQFIVLARSRRNHGVFAKRALASVPFRTHLPRARQIGERAPPLLPALT